MQVSSVLPSKSRNNRRSLILSSAEVRENQSCLIHLICTVGALGSTQSKQLRYIAGYEQASVTNIGQQCDLWCSAGV